jgi:hypothetical protein
MAYANRTDLNNPAKKLAAKAATGQTYGEAGKQLASQRAVPMGGAPSDNVPAPQPMIPPGAMGPLDRPTERPNEPVTAGSPFGPGPGPEALAAPLPGVSSLTQKETLIAQLRQAYTKYPNTAILQLLLELESQPL